MKNIHEKKGRISSLEELKLGDVLDVSYYGGCVVDAIGEVPEHDKEVVLRMIYPPQTRDSRIIDRRIVLRERGKSDHVKGDYLLEDFKTCDTLDRGRYKDWKYKGFKGIEKI